MEDGQPETQRALGLSFHRQTVSSPGFVTSPGPQACTWTKSTSKSEQGATISAEKQGEALSSSTFHQANTALALGQQARGASGGTEDRKAGGQHSSRVTFHPEVPATPPPPLPGGNGRQGGPKMRRIAYTIVSQEYNHSLV